MIEAYWCLTETAMRRNELAARAGGSCEQGFDAHSWKCTESLSIDRSDLCESFDATLSVSLG